MFGEEETTEGTIWDEHKKERAEKKRQNVISSLALLDHKGIEYKTLSEGTRHYRVGDWDFWPSTGKFYNQKTKEKGRGVRNLIKKL